MKQVNDVFNYSIRYFIQYLESECCMKIEPENAMIINITSDKRYLDLNSLYIYLKKDNVLTTFIKQIKIYNETLNGYELFTSETQVEIRNDMITQLVIILDNSVLNHDYHNKELYFFCLFIINCMNAIFFKHIKGIIIGGVACCNFGGNA